MKNVLFVCVLLFSLVGYLNSCSSKLERQTVCFDEVNVDTLTNLVTFKKNDKKVTGSVVKKVWNDFVEEEVLEIYKVVDGNIQNVTRNYFNGNLYQRFSHGGRKIYLYQKSGELWQKCYLTKDFQDSVWYIYDRNGALLKKRFVDFENKQQICITYENNLPVEETTFDEKGYEIKTYDFDKNGEKIIPDVEKLELLKYQTGFYRQVNYNREEVLYSPIVIMQWKNISDKPLTKSIELKCVFISGTEEWSTNDTYLQTSYGAPLQSGLSRQVHLISSVGYTSPYGISRANVKCQIYINNQLYKTIRIQNKQLSSNRLQ